MKPKILIGIPTMASVHTMIMVLVGYWISQAYRENKYDLLVYPTICVQPVDNARNNIVEEFLKTDATHLFFLDSDTIPPMDVIPRLLAHNKPIVSGITPIIEENPKTGEFYRKWNCVGLDNKIVQPHTGLITTRGVGGSCVMIKREVFENMKPPYFRFSYADDNGKQTIVSEDILFVIKAIEKGYKPVCDTSVVCKHFKSTMW